MRGLSHAPSLLVAFAVFVGLAPGGCQPAVSYPSPSPTRLIPTIAGVVDHVAPYGVAIILTDGRTVDDPENSDVQRLGPTPEAGDLVLASTTPPSSSSS